MKEAELRKHATCQLCGNLVGKTSLLLFWVVTVERYGLVIRNIQRQDGLAAMMGSPALAGVMGTDADMARRLIHIKLTICETCGIEKDFPIAALAEYGEDEEHEPG